MWQVGALAVHAIETAEKIQQLDVLSQAEPKLEPEPEPEPKHFADVAMSVVKLPETLQNVQQAQHTMMNPVHRGRARRTNTVSKGTHTHMLCLANPCGATRPADGG